MEKMVDLFIAYTKFINISLFIYGMVHSAHNFVEKQHILVMDMSGHLTIKYKLS